MDPAAATGALPDSGDKSLTDTLGCTHTIVSGAVLEAGDHVELERGMEQLVVPLFADAPLSIGHALSIPPTGVGFVSGGDTTSIRTKAACSLVIVGALTHQQQGSTVTIDLRRVGFPEPSTSDVGTARLTSPLGCHAMKVNARRLHPGQHVPYHTEGSQEELFIPIAGPASMLIDGEERDTPVGTVTRIAPHVPRSAVNPGDEDAIWLMIGAPPTGGPDDWDPGATILE